MVFSSTIFLFAFLPLTLAGYYLIDRRFKNYFLLAASLAFYAWGEPKFVFVMIGSLLVNHLLALLIDRNTSRAKELADFSTRKPYERRAKAILVMMVAFNLSLFFVYKYLDFTIANINAVGSLFGAKAIPMRNIALPIGISFFTFQAMSYVFDVYYGRGRVQKNPLNTMLYVALFPQLIAGPIVRYETVAEEITNRKETLEDFVRGIKRFTIGLGKKAILANSLAIIADRAFGYTDYSQLTVLMAWFGALAFSLQLYYDFSGYSDMAIGLGLMFGFHFEENFNYPYISGSVTEFWRRWHISLGSWFRDYVYIPLGGSRVPQKRLVMNLFIVWLLTGIWHGAAWNFVVWGLMYFVLLTFEKLTGWPGKLSWRPAGCIYRLWTLLVVMLGWVLFNSSGLTNGLRYAACMFGLMGNRLTNDFAIFLIKNFFVRFFVAALLCTPAAKVCRDKFLRGRETPLADGFLCIGILILSIAYIVNTPYDPFIYFNF